MVRKVKNLVWDILNLTPIGPLVQLYLMGEIKENGWFLSFSTKKSVDKNGNSIPWYTYPAVDFLKEKLNKNLVVFEYGCGGSTKWLAERVGKIIAVEDNKGWKEFVEKEMPLNAQILFQPIENEDSYSKIVSTTNLKYDLIIVDGKERNECITNCIESLKDCGLIILDDSFREAYNPSFQLMSERGFKQINFWGMTPIVATKSCTTIFYRNNNAFFI